MADFATIQRYLDQNAPDSSRPVATKILELLIKNKPREKWILRRRQDGGLPNNNNKIDPDEDCKPPAIKKHKPNDNEEENCVINDNNIFHSMLTQKEITLKVSSFLDPHDIPCFLQTCKGTYETTQGKTNELLVDIRLQSIFGYFSILQNYANQLIKLGYTGEELVNFLTHLAQTMQKIYGQRYEVHPIHRALVADYIVNEIAGAHYYEDGDEDDPVLGYDNSNRPLFHPRAPKLVLTGDDLLFTKFHRFCWSVVLGDNFYSFSQCGAFDYGHDQGHIDLNLRQNMLDCVSNKRGKRKGGYINLYMYIDEDNFNTVFLHKSNNVGEEEDNLLYVSVSEQFKSLAHYYVFGERSSMLDNDNRPYEFGNDVEYDSDDEFDPDDNPKVKEDRILKRLHWLYQRKLVDITHQDWKDILEVAEREGDFDESQPLAVVVPGSFPKPQPQPQPTPAVAAAAAAPSPAAAQAAAAAGNEDIIPLTPYEQDRLTDAINNLCKEPLLVAIQIIRESLLASGKIKPDDDDDEMELDIEQLNATTQRKLFHHVFGGDHLPGVRGKGLLLKRPR